MLAPALLRCSRPSQFAPHIASGVGGDSTPLREPRKLGKVPAMRLASYRNLPARARIYCAVLGPHRLPEKGSRPDKTTAEPERAEPDDEGKATEAKKPAAAAPAPAAPAAEKKEKDDDKDKGGW